MALSKEPMERVLLRDPLIEFVSMIAPLMPDKDKKEVLFPPCNFAFGNALYGMFYRFPGKRWVQRLAARKTFCCPYLECYFKPTLTK